MKHFALNINMRYHKILIRPAHACITDHNFILTLGSDGGFDVHSSVGIELYY